MDCKELVLVDDSDALREAFTLFARGRGYDIAAFPNGREALEYLRGGSSSVGLVILDLAMPDMNGFEFLEQRELDDRLQQVPVVVLTALTEWRAPKLPGVQAVLHKPVEPDVLFAVIERHCGLPPRAWTQGGLSPTSAGARVIRGSDFDAWQRSRNR